MIDAAYVLTLARYNAWQNSQLMRIFDVMDHGDLTKDRGAFFKSILGTANHIIWGDTLWMNRFDPAQPRPSGTMEDSPNLFPTISAWSAERFQLDGRIKLWAEGLKSIDLCGDLTMRSRIKQIDMTRPVSYCVTHFFNHQTHHRGQIHAMLTSAGQTAPVSDLFCMPEDA